MGTLVSTHPAKTSQALQSIQKQLQPASLFDQGQVNNDDASAGQPAKTGDRPRFCRIRRSAGAGAIAGHARRPFNLPIPVRLNALLQPPPPCQPHPVRTRCQEKATSDSGQRDLPSLSCSPLESNRSRTSHHNGKTGRAGQGEGGRESHGKRQPSPFASFILAPSCKRVGPSAKLFPVSLTSILTEEIRRRWIAVTDERPFKARKRTAPALPESATAGETIVALEEEVGEQNRIRRCSQ